MRNMIGALSGVFILAACGGGGTTASNTPSPVSNAPSPTPAINFTMTAQNTSGVTGTGQIVKAAGSFTVTIKLTGMTPNSSHISHVHKGACATPGDVAYALQQVVADSSGAATVISTVQADYSVPAAGWYVNVHHGPDFSAPANGPSVSCGDLPTA